MSFNEHEQAYRNNNNNIHSDVRWMNKFRFAKTVHELEDYGKCARLTEINSAGDVSRSYTKMVFN